MGQTIATLFSGGEGVGIGARAAGLQHIWGIENDDRIAQVARANGFPVITADVTEENPSRWECPDILHASPPCPNFSCAKQGAVETQDDVNMARAIARFITTLQPVVFTLENVWAYRKSRAWRIVADALEGYWYDVGHINAADFGVPQTRRRMIVRAVRGRLLPALPEPEPWRGWYDAIADLIPSLPRSAFANWQMAGLRSLGLDLLVDSAGYPDTDGIRTPVQRRSDEPANTIVANHARRPMRAFIVGGQYGQPAGTAVRSPQVKAEDEPSFVVTATYKGDWRAFVVDGANAGRAPTIRNVADPIFTIDAARNSRHPRTMCVDGQVVKLSVRALARLQSFPDSYVLPDNQTLAAQVVGNAVPPLLYEKIVQLFGSCGDLF